EAALLVEPRRAVVARLYGEADARAAACAGPVDDAADELARDTAAPPLGRDPHADEEHRCRIVGDAAADHRRAVVADERRLLLARRRARAPVALGERRRILDCLEERLRCIRERAETHVAQAFPLLGRDLADHSPSIPRERAMPR